MKKNKIMFVLALVFAGMAAWLANSWVQRQASLVDKAGADANTSLVVIAAVDIAYGQKIEPVHLRRVSWPNTALPAGWIGDLEVLKGMVAKRQISAGEVVTQSRVAQHLVGSKLAALIGKNRRAMTVRVDDVVGVAGFLLPGNRVDIYGVRKNYKTRKVKVKTVLSDINVLAVDQDANQKEGGPKVVRAVTLEVTSKQAKRLVKAMHEGKIQLALRNPIDRLTKKVVKKKIKKRRRKPKRTAKIAPKPTPKPTMVTIIRGLAVDKVEPKLEEGTI
jgi:pilus assembly protein CpaB